MRWWLLSMVGVLCLACGAGGSSSHTEGDAQGNGGDVSTVGSSGGGPASSVAASGTGAATTSGGGMSSSDGGGGSGGDGGDAGEDCSSYPYSAGALLAEREGFGADTTGGDPSNVYHVTTLAGSGSGSLKQALESSSDYWIVFDVDGLITLSGGVAQVESHKTIDGRGRSITIEGNLKVTHERNIIISDVRLTNTLETPCTQEGDVITVRGTGTTPSSYTARNIWLHHVELFEGGDGLFDLRGASLVTLSWSHLHTHKKAMLFSRQHDQSPAPGMRVTMHHNFFDSLTLRGPQLKYGKAHYYNNYQYHWYEYGAASLTGAELYSENNIYEARPGSYCIPSCPDPNPCGDNDFTVSKKALVTDWADNGSGYTKSVGDLALNGAVIEENGASGVFNPVSEYSYTADPASQALATKIAAEAGPRVNYCQ